MNNVGIVHEFELCRFGLNSRVFPSGSLITALKIAIRYDTMRLLTKADAAGYCRLSVTTFERVCPVRPVELEPGNTRLLRYDVRDLDAWIDAMKNGAKGSTTSADISNDDYLARLDK